MKVQLPIQDIHNTISLALRQGNQLIILAPPGSGKSTRVPQYIHDEVLTNDKKVLVLQPRRIATRMLADYIARERNSATGEEVGYQIRLESRHSPATRILFLTEGILLKRLLHGDQLEDTGAVVFDEFHERHSETDLSLALTLALQQRSRPDLKIVVMSATLDPGPLKSYLSQSTFVETSGTTYPVKISYAPPAHTETIWDQAAYHAASAIRSNGQGSVLVFMPGSYEIRRTTSALAAKSLPADVKVLPLHGSLSRQEQDEAVNAPGRKIIVSTNVAETSLTIQGITTVIDSGQARISRYDAHRGINTLFTEPISRSSAEQRAGRAGRTATGNCIRLWSEFDHQHRKQNDIPEIHRIDLSEILLGLLAGTHPDLNTFNWFEAPEPKAISKALHLIETLGAVTATGKITPKGLKMAAMNVHPRTAIMLLKAIELNCLPAACVIAALIQGQNILLSAADPQLQIIREELFGLPGSDLLVELNAWLYASNYHYGARECACAGINANVARQTGLLAQQLLAQAGNYKGKHMQLPVQNLTVDEENSLKQCIMAGYIDFVAVKLKAKSATCRMTGGKSGQLHKESSVKEGRLMVATELEEARTPSGVLLFLKKVTLIEEPWLRDAGTGHVTFKTHLTFDAELKRVVEITEEYIDDLLINRSIAETNNHDEASEILTRAILANEISFEQWNEQVEQYVRRVNFAALNAPQYQIPAIDEHAKAFIIQQSIYKCRGMKDIQRVEVWPALRGWLRYEQQAAVDFVAPETIVLPHRKRPVRLRYDDKGDVILSETVQGLYDCPLPVTVAEGRVKVVFEILSPARRPVQITRDLDYFWKNSYLEIKKELKGRYPKHEWR